MMEEQDGNGDFIQTDVHCEFYMRGRDDPIQAFVGFKLSKEHLEPGDEVRSFQQIITTHLLSEIDTVGTHRMVLSDRRFNKQIIIIEEIQAISVLAPDPESFK